VSFVIDEMPKSDIDFVKEFHRFQTKDKSRAFALMEELETKEKIIFDKVIEKDGKRYRRFIKTSWRTSMNFKNRITFDIDDHDKQNLDIVLSFYEPLFDTKFNVIFTKHGYHLISKNKYASRFDWNYNLCRVLYPILKVGDYQNYRYQLDRFYKTRKEERDNKELSRRELQELTKDFEQKFKRSGLYCGCGDFEILYAVNVLMRGFYSLRISKKDKKDNPVVVL
jgi:hypothetical protein